PSSPVLPPPPPNITVMPEKMEYLIGDTVAIQCTAPRTREKIQGFQVSGTSGWAVDVRTTRRTYVHRFNITGPRDAGVHACTYVIVNQFRQPVRSQDSKSIFINVRDHPPRPTLELNSSSGVTVEGQPLVFRCAAPAQPTERRFHFYKEKVEVVTGVKLILGDAEGQLQVAKSVQNHTGNFSCGYEEKTEGRWIPSYPSRDVEVIVREPASAPRLAVEPPVGVVSEDYPLRLTCKASRAAFRLRYRFYRNGVEIPEGHADSQRRDDGPLSELYFQQSPRSFGGKFSCGVEEDVGGTWVPAPRSDAVDITVK
ncbi:FCRL5 protein, partial [Rhynochetos jubatus]|nr:FCRL5 protein [Rhynochetos jubatus]